MSMIEKNWREYSLHSRGAALLLAAVLALGLGGCKKREAAEIAVPHVRDAKESQVSQTEEQKEAALGLETKPGTVLGEEEVTLMIEGESQTVSYIRIQGSGGYSIAYDPVIFSLESDEVETRLVSLKFPEAGEWPAVFVSIRTEEGVSLEELADTYVYNSDEECTVEEVTVGEGEYPATWISYTEGTDSMSRTCDLYLLRYNEKNYVMQLDCFLEAYEGLGEVQQTILSTLRFDEG